MRTPSPASLSLKGDFVTTAANDWRAALECGSLLPLSARELARTPMATELQCTAGKPAWQKRQQAAALQSACGALA